MKIATWNVNSVKARTETVVAWLKAANPDVVVFQEIKCVDYAVPRQTFEDLGYNCAAHGQKTYNGGAILSKSDLRDVVEYLTTLKATPKASAKDETPRALRHWND